MRIQFLAAGLVVMLLGADAPKENPAKEEVAKLEGTWTVVSQSAGRNIQRMVIKENRATLILGVLTVPSELVIDPTKDPKHLDRIFVDGPYKGAMLGIYQLDGDELKYCYNTGAFFPRRNVRPTEFQGDLEKDGTILLILKREKP